jgi:hypothetical protein
LNDLEGKVGILREQFHAGVRGLAGQLGTYCISVSYFLKLGNIVC